MYNRLIKRTFSSPELNSSPRLKLGINLALASVDRSWEGVCGRTLAVHTHARFASLFGFGGLFILLALALLATPTQASTIVFFDNFQSDTAGNNPVIGSGDVGTSWSDEVAPGVEVVLNPHMTGNTSSQVLQLWNKGAMDGNFSTGILFDGAALSTDFYISSDSASNKITIKFRTAAGWGPL